MLYNQTSWYIFSEWCLFRELRIVKNPTIPHSHWHLFMVGLNLQPLHPRCEDMFSPPDGLDNEEAANFLSMMCAHMDFRFSWYRMDQQKKPGGFVVEGKLRTRNDWLNTQNLLTYEFYTTSTTGHCRTSFHEIPPLPHPLKPQVAFQAHDLGQRWVWPPKCAVGWVQEWEWHTTICTVCILFLFFGISFVGNKGLKFVGNGWKRFIQKGYPNFMEIVLKRR